MLTGDKAYVRSKLLRAFKAVKVAYFNDRRKCGDRFDPYIAAEFLDVFSIAVA